MLRSPLFGFTDDHLASLTASADSVWDALREADDEQFADAAQLLTVWQELAGCVHSERVEARPWNQVLTRVIDDTGYLASIGADEGGAQAVANVEKFRDEIRDWSEGGTRTAASLLRRIDRQTELDPREGEAEVPDGTDGVRIITIHAAKGLEFPIVTVPDLGSDLNFGRSIDDYGYVRLVTDHDDAPFLAAGGPSPADAFDVEKTTAHSIFLQLLTSHVCQQGFQQGQRDEFVLCWVEVFGSFVTGQRPDIKVGLVLRWRKIRHRDAEVVCSWRHFAEIMIVIWGRCHTPNELMLV